MFQIVGTIDPPEPLQRFGTVTTGGPGNFLQLIFDLMIVGGGIYALINLILAGYSFLSAGSDSKQIEAAWAKIWQSVIGLVFIAGSFLLAAIFGQLIFGSPTAILNPTLPTLP